MYCCQQIMLSAWAVSGCAIILLSSVGCMAETFRGPATSTHQSRNSHSLHPQAPRSPVPRRPSPVPKRPSSPARWQHDGSDAAAAAARVEVPKAAAAAAAAPSDQQRNGTAPAAAAQHMTAAQKAAQLVPDSFLEAAPAAAGGSDRRHDSSHRRRDDGDGSKRASRRAQLEAPRADSGAKASRWRSGSPVAPPQGGSEAAAVAASSRWILRQWMLPLRHVWCSVCRAAARQRALSIADVWSLAVSGQLKSQVQAQASNIGLLWPHLAMASLYMALRHRGNQHLKGCWWDQEKKTKPCCTSSLCTTDTEPIFGLLSRCPTL